MEERNRSVLLYIPNIIGYIRIVLTVLAFLCYKQPHWFVILFAVSISLDGDHKQDGRAEAAKEKGVDGYAARKLNQCSEFGAWFDVVVDLFSRGLLWCSLYQYGYLVSFVEWLTFVCTHCRGERWKIPEKNFPWLVIRVMENGFKTPWGVAAIGGLDVLPLWLYALETGYFSTHLPIPVWTPLAGLVILIMGRLLCLFVEGFYIYSHVLTLLHHDTVKDRS